MGSNGVRCWIPNTRYQNNARNRRRRRNSGVLSCLLPCLPPGRPVQPMTPSPTQLFLQNPGQPSIPSSQRFSSVQFSSVAQSCPTLCDPMDCSTPGFPVHHQLLELAQTQVHQVGDGISSSVIPFSSFLQSFPASGCFTMSQFFTSGSQSIGDLASVLPMNIQD